MDFAQLQQSTVAHLKRHVVDESVLEARCPLEHGKHSFQPPADASLGALDALPNETKDHTLAFLDIESLLTFRRISKTAMNLVDSQLDYQKIITNAPNALRMAAAIGVHHTYTINNLFDALRSHTYADCGTRTHYVCPFTCRRICLSQNGWCPGRLHCHLQTDAEDHYLEVRSQDVDHALTIELKTSCPNFTPVPGAYTMYRSTMVGEMSYCTYVQPGDIYIDAIADPEAKIKLAEHMRTDDANIGYSVLHKSMSVGVAPWLSFGDMDGQYGMRCDICRVEDEKGARYLFSHLSWALPGKIDCAQIVGTR
jgi:hypothetical protein